ncbi:hypothetical protein BJ508DRAFT_337018, partial [Ascobolus immersus RN42]
MELLPPEKRQSIRLSIYGLGDRLKTDFCNSFDNGLQEIIRENGLADDTPPPPAAPHSPPQPPPAPHSPPQPPPAPHSPPQPPPAPHSPPQPPPAPNEPQRPQTVSSPSIQSHPSPQESRNTSHNHAAQEASSLPSTKQAPLNLSATQNPIPPGSQKPTTRKPKAAPTTSQTSKTSKVPATKQTKATVPGPPKQPRKPAPVKPTKEGKRLSYPAHPEPTKKSFPTSGDDSSDEEEDEDEEDERQTRASVPQIPRGVLMHEMGIVSIRMRKIRKGARRTFEQEYGFPIDRRFTKFSKPHQRGLRRALQKYCRDEHSLEVTKVHARQLLIYLCADITRNMPIPVVEDPDAPYSGGDEKPKRKPGRPKKVTKYKVSHGSKTSKAATPAQAHASTEPTGAAGALPTPSNPQAAPAIPGGKELPPTSPDAPLPPAVSQSGDVSSQAVVESGRSSSK